ncbi:hypothetical protein [Nocardioides sp.]|uniref:hypothetical protein n=1 Tax=Nocardioides sp. TaxID=35761 RepID=UPI002B26C166|nr:hypothetical protein [Nocardioides sp.]
MTTLKQRLDQLAEDAPDGSASQTPEGDLWRRGKRLQRRQGVVTASFVAALVIGIGALSSLVMDARSYSVPVADNDTEVALGLPSRLYVPSPWTPSTDETGPIGPLVALVSAYRRATTWGGEAQAFAGVSAAGGYAFLTLEDLADTEQPETPVAPSPDGRWLAYYLTGATASDPYVSEGDPVVGVALYDSVTGETKRTVLETDHGLHVDDLTWVGDTLLAEYGQITEFSSTPESSGLSADIVGFLRWDTSDGALEPAVPYKVFPNFYESSPGPDGTLVVKRGRCAFDLLSADGSIEPLSRLDVLCEGPVHLSPDGQRVVTTEDVDGAGRSTGRPGPMVVADVSGPDEGVIRVLDEKPDAGVIGWADDTHLIVQEYDETDQSRRYVSLDVDTGERVEVMEQPRGFLEYPVLIASDALTGPGFAAPEPDFPSNPRYAWALGGALVVLLGGNFLWRHRVRR